LTECEALIDLAYLPASGTLASQHTLLRL
jgi:hypothetical protein